MRARVLRTTSIFVLLVVVGVAAFGSLALLLTSAGQSLSERFAEKYNSGELEQSFRLLVRRIAAQLHESDSAIDLSVEIGRDDLPETKIIQAIQVSERTPAIMPDDPEIPSSWRHSFGDPGSRKYADIP